MVDFKGQISVSRDLRQNKQSVFGKYSITDIIFIVIAVGSAILLAYTFGFLLKVIDEFTAVALSIVPMIIILMFGFRKVAGMRYFYYLMMKFIDAKEKNRKNKSYINKVIDIRKENVKNKVKNVVKKDNKKYLKDKFIFAIDVDQKNLNRVINEVLNYENLNLLMYRVIRDKITRKIINRVVMSLKYENQYDILAELYIMFGRKSGIKFVSSEEIINEETHIEKDKIVVYLLHIYDRLIYKKFIREVKRYAEVVTFIKRIDQQRYINTFLCIDDNTDTIKEYNKKKRSKKKKSNMELISEIASEYNVILNKLTKEQGIARSAVSYYMINTYNAYRKA